MDHHVELVFWGRDDERSANAAGSSFPDDGGGDKIYGDAGDGGFAGLQGYGDAGGRGAHSRNGAGVHDYLYPLNALKAQDLHFSVYNRFGLLVFETTDWLKRW